jgi:predicted ATPase/DNA-binding SARP family transcriptional activator
MEKPSMFYLALFLLGQPRIERDGEQIKVPLRKATALLFYLATTGEPHSRDAIATLFWPECNEGAALNTLRVNLHALKKTLGEGWLVVDREAVGLRDNPNLWVDVCHFNRLLAECRTHNHSADAVCPACLSPLAEAVQLYRDDFLAGFTLHDSASFDDWQRIQTEAMRREAIQALDKLARFHSTLGEFGRAIAYTQRWLALDPLHESAHRMLMQLYTWSDQRQAALAQYEDCVQLLQKELGEAPQEVTTQLYQAIRENRLSPPTIPSPTLSLAPRSFALLAHPIPFVGREKELAYIAKLLKEPTCRLLTLAGPGGIGKTRLALQVAAENATAFPDGVWFVTLAALNSPDLLPSAIAQALNLSSPGGMDIKAQLLHHLQERQALLVLDNLEHLIEGTSILGEILSKAPGVKLLVTSRERLSIQWEWLFQIHGLEFPKDETGAIEEYSAVQLFLQSARRACSDFALVEQDRPYVVRICRFLNGMPLGIELAATWTQMLSCQEIAQEIERNLDFPTVPMRDLPERHRSLRAVFDHSWNLLSGAERKVFGKLSVFRGGFRREAAEQVAGASLPLLSALARKSLLHRPPAGRYEILEVLRQYAEEKLKENLQEWEETSDRHCEYYLVFLQDREPHLKGARQAEALEEIAQEIENVRAAWQWAMARSKWKEIDRSQESLHLFYNIRNWFQEGMEAFGRAADRLRSTSDDSTSLPKEQAVIFGRLFARQGYFCDRLWQFDKAKELSQASLAIFDRLGVRGETAFPLRSLARVALDIEDYVEARRLYRASLAVYQENGDRWGVARCLNSLGYIALRLEEYHEARRLLREGLVISKEIGDQWGTAYCLNDLGFIALALEEYHEAEQLLQESLSIYKRIGDRQGMATSLSYLGLVTVGRGEYHEARQIYQNSIAIWQEIGYQQEIAYTFVDLGLDFYILGEYQEARQCFQKALKTALDAQSVFAAVKALAGTVTLLMKEGEKSAAPNLVDQVFHHPAIQGKVKDGLKQALASVDTNLHVYVRHSPALYAEFMSGVQEIKNWVGQQLSL